MTREELHTEVATLTGEIVGMVSDLSPFDYKRKAEIDKEILALFDRYEREMWSRDHPGEPSDRLIVIGWVNKNECHVTNAYDWWLYADYAASRWREIELPPGPEGGK